MMHRRVFSAENLAIAQACVAAARQKGMDDDNIALIARSDIEIESIPNERLDASADTVPAGCRGAAGGAVAGLLAGLIALAIPSFGMTFGGIALLTLIGALVGAWSAALAGSAIPNPVRRAFGKEIEAGRILVVIDAAKDKLPAVEAAIAAAGAAQLPFDMPSAMT
jgi:predicted lipid-binding transport protein (Tim44 family)